MATPEDRVVLGSFLRPRGPIRLALTKNATPELTVLELAGELDVLTAARLGVELDCEVRQRGGDVVVDLRQADYVDSAGMHVLLNAHRRLARQGRSFAVVCRPGPVRRAFELAKLIETLGVVPSVREYRRRAQARAAAGAASGRLGI